MEYNSHVMKRRIERAAFNTQENNYVVAKTMRKSMKYSFATHLYLFS